MTRHTRFHLAWALPATTAAVVYSVWCVTRHWRFGSGSWDLGVRSQSIWLLAHMKGVRSSVLGDVNFMGDHFMPALALFAPVGWIGSIELLLCVQALLIASAALPLALLCRRRRLGALTVSGLAFAYLFGVGTQSTANFDFHEVAILPLALLSAVWAFEEGRRPMAYAALIVAAGCRESAILYAAAVGGWLVTRAGRRVEGLAIALAGAALFFVVVSWIQPYLLRDAPASMVPLARFSAMGSDVAEVAVWLVTHPLQAARLLVSPSEKLVTLAITFGGFAFLPLLAPDALLLAVPNFVERFLSNKVESWGVGFHYSLVPTALSAYAAAVGLSRLRDFLDVRWKGFRPALFDVSAGSALVLATLGAAVVTMPVGVELVSLEKPYFASPEQAAVNRRAIAVVPNDAAVMAQNHFVPHLAMREHVWLLEERFLARADYVVLDPTQNAWPWDRPHVERLARTLLTSPDFHVVFSERATVVFSRRGAAAVAPAP